MVPRGVFFSKARRGSEACVFPISMQACRRSLRTRRSDTRPRDAGCPGPARPGGPRLPPPRMGCANLRQLLKIPQTGFQFKCMKNFPLNSSPPPRPLKPWGDSILPPHPMQGPLPDSPPPPQCENYLQGRPDPSPSQTQCPIYIPPEFRHDFDRIMVPCFEWLNWRRRAHERAGRAGDGFRGSRVRLHPRRESDWPTAPLCSHQISPARGSDRSSFLPCSLFLPLFWHS